MAWFEPRWSAYRPLVQDSLVWSSLLLIGSFLHLGDFDFGRPLTVVWFVAVAGEMVATAGYFLYNERLARTQPSVTST